MYERDCQEVFGHLLNHDPLQQSEESRLEQTQQQICDYFGQVDRLVWAKPSTPAALFVNIDPVNATMQQWLDHINQMTSLREGLLEEDVYLTVLSQHTKTAETYAGKETVLSFFHSFGHATRAREFLSVDTGAFALEITKNQKMGANIFEVNPEGKIFDIKIFMGSLRDDEEDLNDSGLTNVTSLQARISAVPRCDKVVATS